jgi:hypothetical protein
MVDVGRALIWILVNRGLLTRHPEHRYDTQLQHLQHKLQSPIFVTCERSPKKESRIPNPKMAFRQHGPSCSLLDLIFPSAWGLVRPSEILR